MPQLMAIAEVVDKLHSRMLPQQRQAFRDEQELMIGKVFIGRKPLASVCIVFGEKDLAPDSRPDNAYLPYVSRFVFGKNGPTTFDVIYIDVAETARLDANGVVRWGVGPPKNG